MAFGFFNIEEPGLTYSQRKSYKADTALVLDPINDAAPVMGEWLELQADQSLARSVYPAAEVKLAFPVLVDKSRTDVQSGGNLTVLAHPGAICQTAMFATLDRDDGAMDYTVGDLLGLCTFLDELGKTRSGIYPLGKDAVTPGTPGSGGLNGSIIEINRVGAVEGTYAVAKVLRVPYSISGVGVNAGTGFPADSANPRQVIDIQII